MDSSITSPSTLDTVPPEGADSLRGSRLLRVARRLGSGTPWGVAVALSSAMVVALLAEDDATRRALWPGNWERGGTFQPESLLLVVLAGLTVLYGIADVYERRRQHSENEARFAGAEEARLEAERRASDANAALAANLNRIAERQEVLPEAGFVRGFFEAAASCHTSSVVVLTTSGNQRSLDLVLQSIRTVLYSVTNLVRTFEGTPMGATYSANVMVFIPSGRIRGKLRERLSTRMTVKPDALDVTQLRGVLDLHCSMSSITGVEPHASRDPHLREFALPVPQRYSEADGLLALPGAPKAFCTNRVDFCPNVGDLPARCLQEGLALKPVADQIREHFLKPEAGHIRSFLSLPVVPSSDRNSPVAVVNVNCSIIGLLQDERRQELIQPYLRALLFPLPELIEIAISLERRAGR